MAATREPVAVVLLSMGGADRQEAIEPFLRNLFSDPLIIPVPGPVWFRRFVGRRMARKRTPIVTPYYQRIGFSPLNALTQKQAQALEAQLGARFRCFAAFRYWGPTEAEAVESALAQGARSVVALPMYPQYCRATTLSSLQALRAAAQGRVEIREIDRFFVDPTYVDALARSIERGLGQFPTGASPHIVFSAHGVPENLAKKGDPYVKEVEATTQAVVGRLKAGAPWHLTYQSRVGPVKWVKPWTDQVLPELAQSGVQAILMVPITFVTDQLETIDEMDIRLKEIAVQAGIRHFHRVPALNDDPAFVQALAQMVRAAL